MHVLMLFLDGVGIGRKEAAVNPFFVARLPALHGMLDGELPTLHRREIRSHEATAVPLDATLGVDGLPQSGTGQTSLFAGVNGAKIAGKHFGPHPYSTLKPVLKERSIFAQLLAAGKSPCFANAFPQRFFDYAARHRARLTVTTLCCAMCGIPLRREEDLRDGKGISADITGDGWRELGYPDMPSIDPREAGRRLARLTQMHDFVLFEYWKTDHAGHARSMEEAVRVLELFDAMLAGILEALDTTETVLFITSDHGNVEDLSTKTHTRNPVPAILYGHRHAELATAMRAGHGDLSGVTPALMQFLVPAS